MNRKFSNSTIVYSSGRTTSICDCCGKEHRQDYGFKIEHARRNCCGKGRFSLCGKCADFYLPIIEIVMKDISNHGGINDRNQNE